MKTNNNWPDEIRLEMIEMSKLYYPEDRIYQYGYYDGYQEGIKKNERK